MGCYWCYWWLWLLLVLEAAAIGGFVVGAQSRHPGANLSDLGVAPNWGVDGRVVAGCNTGERATGSGELGSSAPVAARRVGIRLCLATSTDRNVALDSRNYQAVLLLLSKYLLLEYLLTTASRAATPSCSRASRRARPTTTSGPPTSSCPRSTAEPAPTPRSRRWREAHACCGLAVGIRGQA